jgi:uncharacterized protein (UPF0218 family)
MTVAYRLTPELRRRLKEPLGELLRGSFIQTMRTVAEMIEKEKPTSIISVGDTVSRNLVKNHILPQLLIIDNTCMRRKTTEATPSIEERIVHVKNPKATITKEAITEIQDALKSGSRVKIVVDGEEDLLTLITVLYAPQNSFVLYGQPHEGVVVIRATAEKKGQIESILNEMSNN